MDQSALEARLKERRRELSGDITEIEHALDAPMPSDWEDRSSERQGDEVLEALGLADVAEIRRIDAALARMRDGSYGVCMKCGEQISEARLDPLPDTALRKLRAK